MSDTNATTTKPTARRRTTCTPVTRFDVLRASLLAIVLTVALVIGLGQFVVMKNDSIWISVAGFAIGAAVQIALCPLAHLMRMLCQLWFTYHVTTHSMDAEKVLAGTIGNLYDIEPTLSVRATGTWPLLGQTMNAAFDANQANDVSQGNMFGAICSPTYQAGTMTVDPVVTCSADKTVCQAIVDAALHPLMSDSFGIPYQFGFTQVDSGDLVSGSVMGAQIKVSCNSTQDFVLTASPDPPSWAVAQVQVNITLPTPSGGSEMFSIPDGVTYQTPGLPEIGMLPTYVRLESGAYLSLLFAKDFEQDFLGFKQFKDPVYGRNLGLTQISVGTATVETEITYTTPALATRATKVDIVGPTTQVNITANDALLSALDAINYWLSCLYWYCPRSPVIPTFDRLCLLLTEPATLADFDWEGQQATTMQGFAKATMMQFAAFALVTSAENPNITVPVTVRTKNQYSRLVISGSCTAILLAGAVASVVMIILKLVTDFAGRRYPALDAGLNITDSVYSFLSAFQSQFVSSSTTLDPGGDGHHHQGPQRYQHHHPPDSDPSRVRVGLTGKKLTLSNASFRHLRIDGREPETSLAVHAALEKAGGGVVADDENGRAERGETRKLLPAPAAAAQRTAEVEENESL
ncbi:hypothetical protein HDU87_003000 [Geranomyces variabilis]|uniref:Uncharacterized protein n=1 Tax=Geranomyces variabilis TaxID=109894 RepID=A0AAD5TN09_9FUNG|nr:hypothetical protein HDU87_003000 [Geranomyces variabilis]